MSHIFISYSKQDIDFVRYLRAMLENEGFAVWMDEAQLTPSARWWKDIEKNIDACSAFVVVMSPDAYESDWVEREVLRAENKKKPLYPVLLAGDPWSRLANIQFEDLRAGLRAQLSKRFIGSLRNSGISKPGIQLSIEEGQIIEFEADVLALKYAQAFYGADAVVATLLQDAKAVTIDQIIPEVGEYAYVATQNAVQPANALFVGTPKLRQMGYEQLREFSARVLSALAEAAPQTVHLAMTIHGPGFGLDEIESLLSQVEGYFDGFASGQFPPALKKITIIERNVERVKRLRTALETHFADRQEVTPTRADWGYILSVPSAASSESLEVIPPKPAKPHIFVIMPPDKDLEDVFYFGIQGPTHALGLLCERIEGKIADEDLLNQAKVRISTASAVIAVLTNADSMGYLQLGYAWGAGRPTITLVKEASALPFEIGAILTYGSLKGLESALTEALDDLKAKGVL